MPSIHIDKLPYWTYKYIIAPKDKQTSSLGTYVTEYDFYENEKTGGLDYK